MTTQFIKHIGSVQPISDDSLVSYRTISDEGIISHVHLPVKASDLNWSSEGLSFGRIYDFKIVNVIKTKTGHDSSISEIDKHVEFLPVIGFCYWIQSKFRIYTKKCC